MPSDTLIFRGVEVRIIFLPDRFRPTLQHLNNVRTRMVTGDAMAQAYEGMKSTFAVQLAKEVAQEVPTADTIVVPPSSRSDTQAYLAKILELQPGLRNLSSQMKRKGKIKAIGATSTASVVREFEYQPDGKESSIKSLLILDDIVGTGRTSVSMLFYLCRAGLPSDCEITIVTPFWTKRGSRRAPP